MSLPWCRLYGHRSFLARRRSEVLPHQRVISFSQLAPPSLSTKSHSVWIILDELHSLLFILTSLAPPSIYKLRSSVQVTQSACDEYRRASTSSRSSTQPSRWDVNSLLEETSRCIEVSESFVGYHTDHVRNGTIKSIKEIVHNLSSAQLGT